MSSRIQIASVTNQDHKSELALSKSKDSLSNSPTENSNESSNHLIYDQVFNLNSSIPNTIDIISKK